MRLYADYLKSIISRKLTHIHNKCNIVTYTRVFDALLRYVILFEIILSLNSSSFVVTIDV